ncbi:proline-, glutamic acid- and leucine-rich protein 1-like [Clavelina lepadiformis]|uniref:proline-, glutamic acid- and leucine-rich protein 1-like n=1 Tax=Clavelina lepadiformis TaxID=159417 RepID=UPI00404235E0
MDSINTIFPLLLKKTLDADEEASNINKCIQVTSTKWIGLSLMGRVLSQCQQSLILSYGIAWIKATAQIVTLKYEDDGIRQLAAENFSTLLRYSSHIPEIARELSSSTLSSIIQDVLQSDFSDPLPCLRCLKAALKYFPGSCGALKGKVASFLSAHITSFNMKTQNLAIQCWCYIPVLGGGGTGRKIHTMQWETQCKETIDCLMFVIGKLFDLNQREDVLDPSLNSLSINFQNLPESEPELSFALIKRFIALCKCLTTLLETSCLPVFVNVPVDLLLQTIETCCDIVPKALGFTSEKLLRLGYLSNIHESCLQLFSSLIKSCSQYICRHSTLINHIFGNLLNLWSNTSHTFKQSIQSIDVRVSVYTVMSDWIQCCGTKSRFLCGQPSLPESFLDHFVKDISIISKDTQSVGVVSKQQVSAKGTSKTEKITTDGISTVNGNMFNWKSASLLCSQALKVARLCVYTFGFKLPLNVHKTFQEVVVFALLQLMEDRDTVMPYSKCTVCRKELYHLLLALTLSYHPHWPPPTQFAVLAFAHGSAHECCMEIRSFCKESSVIVANIIRPRLPTLHRCSIDYINNVKKAMQKHYGSTTTNGIVENKDLTSTKNQSINLDPDVVDSRSNESSNFALQNNNEESKVSSDHDMSENVPDEEVYENSNDLVSGYNETEVCKELSDEENKEADPVDRRGLKRKISSMEVMPGGTSTSSTEDFNQDHQSSPPSIDMKSAEDVAKMFDDFVDAGPDDV